MESKQRVCAICGENPVYGRRRICTSISCIEAMKRAWYEESVVVPEGYATAPEYAKILRISQQMVTRNCKAGKYPGAFQDNKSGRWYIPVNKPRKAVLKSVYDAERRKIRPFKTTDKEWQMIVEAAARTKYSTNEYMIRKLLNQLY